MAESLGCYAITDASVDQVYAVVEAALNRGQDGVDVAIFPFVMSEAALAAEAQSTWHPFWANLKHGFDLFEANRIPPRVAACNGQYRFSADADGPGCEPIAGWRGEA
jgi:murein L,D-transpeptidase YafK